MIALVLYYFMLPPINLSSPLFWIYVFIILILFFILFSVGNIDNLIKFRRNYSYSKFTIYMPIIISSLIVLIVIVNLFLSPIFNASKYANRIKVNSEEDFATAIKEVDFSKTPLLDKDSSEKLGDRKMGEFTSWVSQFYK